MKFTKLYFPLYLLAVTLLASCTQVKEASNYMHLGPVEPVHAKTYVYECSDGYSFTSNIKDNKAQIISSGQSIVLPHAFSISAVKFSARQTSLWVEKGVARLEIDSVMHENCYNNPAKATWAHAKLEGVEFRALGNNPSWILEVVKGETIIFANYDGKINRYQFVKPKPEIDQASRQTVFSVANKDHAILITVVGEPCQDTFSGESFDFSVTVKLDNKLFEGCGRSLL